MIERTDIANAALIQTLRAARTKAGIRSGDTSEQCEWCGGPMRPEHAHYRCTACGQRDACCDTPY